MFIAAQNRHKDQSFRKSARHGVTMVEMLIVSAIIVMLIALFVPAISAARRASRKLQCLNNLKQQAISLQSYHDSEGSFPPGWSSDARGVAGWGWGPRLLPYNEQRMLNNSIAYDQPLDSLQNKSTLAQRLSTFQCPADVKIWDSPIEIAIKGGRVVLVAPASYIGSFGSSSLAKCDPMNPSSGCRGDGVFFENSFLSLADFEDGSSHTMMISERRADGLTGVWAGAVPNSKNAIGRIVGHAVVTPNDDSDLFGFSSMHPNGVNVVFGDAGVRFVADDVDPRVFKAIATVRGKELQHDFAGRR